LKMFKFILFAAFVQLAASGFTALAPITSKQIVSNATTIDPSVTVPATLAPTTATTGTQTYPAGTTVSYPAGTTLTLPAGATINYPTGAVASFPTQTTVNYPQQTSVVYPNSAIPVTYPAGTQVTYPAGSTVSYQPNTNVYYPAPAYQTLGGYGGMNPGMVAYPTQTTSSFGGCSRPPIYYGAGTPQTSYYSSPYYRGNTGTTTYVRNADGTTSAVTVVGYTAAGYPISVVTNMNTGVTSTVTQTGPSSYLVNTNGVTTAVSG